MKASSRYRVVVHGQQWLVVGIAAAQAMNSGSSSDFMSGWRGW
ncbi:MAG: hypothetical protein ACKO38_17105 [Planctomycetota bacterium]